MAFEQFLTTLDAVGSLPVDIFTEEISRFCVRRTVSEDDIKIIKTEESERSDGKADLKVRQKVNGHIR